MNPATPTADPLFCFAGGGTGGHLIPGLNVARELQRRYPGAKFLFLGTSRPQERELVAAAGFAHQALPAESTATAQRRPGKFVWGNWRAYRQARSRFREQRPAAVIGLGGFASVSPVVAAQRMGVPVVVMEQNVIPGRATRWLSRRAQAVCLSFERTRALLKTKAKVTHTGNPVHPDIAALVASSHTDPRHTVLVLGGSQGASAINRAMLKVAEQLQTELAGWTITHQTGIGDWRDVEDGYQRLGIEHVTAPFFSDMPLRYAVAGVAVTRAGASTFAELACAGCPAIAVPYPDAADDHQQVNAEEFAAGGAAEIVRERANSQETAEELAARLRVLLADEERRLAMRHAMHALAHPNATRRVADVVEQMLRL